ncbi:Protein SCO1 protein mitochondrial [Fasciola gigantica]|uniref:Protein SCO1 protein mitochondrial n=1 Tax=Fasciola gigantica TaxID=46835 RepID=A0A504YM62_FASGI|nr:Protein SCO1 protein mitochondrial [Fasciola gigantica]
MLRSMGQSFIRGIFKSCPLCPSGHKIIPPINTRLLSWKAFDGNLRKLQWATFISFTGITIGGALYMRHDLKEDEKRRTKSMGRPSIGGDFTLVDHNGKPCSLADFKGKWVLLYFGFCRCPDICPEQLEKVVEISDRVGKFVFSR